MKTKDDSKWVLRFEDIVNLKFKLFAINLLVWKYTKIVEEHILWGARYGKVVATCKICVGLPTTQCECAWEQMDRIGDNKQLCATWKMLNKNWANVKREK